MGTQRERYEQFFAKRRGPRNSADEAAAIEATDAYDAMKSQETPTDAELAILINAAGNPHALVWNCAVDLLRKSLRDWPEVADAIAAMMQARSSTMRFSAMCCVNKDMPARVAREMIKVGLSDKSGQVRWKSGEKANDLRCVEFIPLLERVASQEKPGRTRDSLVSSLQMLRDGYVLHSHEDGTYTLWIDKAPGHAGRSVTEAELKANGVDALVEKFRNEQAVRFLARAPERAGGIHSDARALPGTAPADDQP